MNAHEAREKAYNYNVNIEATQYKYILEKIKDAAANGNYKTSYDGQINPDVKTKLELDNYKISSSFHRNEYYTEISW